MSQEDRGKLNRIIVPKKSQSAHKHKDKKNNIHNFIHKNYTDKMRYQNL